MKILKEIKYQNLHIHKAILYYSSIILVGLLSELNTLVRKFDDSFPLSYMYFNLYIFTLKNRHVCVMFTAINKIFIKWDKFSWNRLSKG